MARLFVEVDHAPLVVDAHDAEGDRFGQRHFEAGDGHFRLPRHMVRQHLFVIHLVDVVAT